MNLRLRRIVALLALLIVAPLSLGDTDGETKVDALTLQLRWLPQAQFMGYYVADTLGLYEQEGLDVTIVPGGPTISPLDTLSTGTADVAVEWLGSALYGRERGDRPVNIAQLFQRSSLMIICKKFSNIRTIDDLQGKTISVWEGSSALGFEQWVEGLERSYGRTVKTVGLKNQDDVMASWLNRRVDCVTATSYNEYWTLLDDGLRLDDATIFRLEDLPQPLLEDGLYVSQERLEDPEFLDRVTRFSRASLAGWQFAVERPAEAVEILLQRFPDLDRVHQLRMANEIVRLIDTSAKPLGRLPVEDFDLYAEFLGYETGVTATQSNITKGAWTHSVWRMLDNHEHSPLSDEVLYRLERVLSSSTFYLIDLVGTLAFGLAGFARASERRYDIWGALILTSLPALGGGTFRDILVGGDRHPPFIFSDPNYFYIVISIVMFGTLWEKFGPTGKPLIDHNSNVFLAIDTIGLAAFSIIGAKVAIIAQLDWFWVPLLAAVTCAGGGIMMDVISGREPRTFRGVIYEEIAILGGLVLMALLYLAQFANNVELFIQVAIAQTFILVYATRIVSVQMGWHAPRLGTARAAKSDG